MPTILSFTWQVEFFWKTDETLKTPSFIHILSFMKICQVVFELSLPQEKFDFSQSR